MIGNMQFKRSIEMTQKVIGGKWKPVILCISSMGSNDSAHRNGKCLI